jgi:putative PEP-CTERM system TPR-repeat lipoprotein
LDSNPTLRRATQVAAIVLGGLLGGCDALTSPAERIERADQEIAAGDYGKASIDLRKALDKEPNNPEARRLLALALLRLGDAPGARIEIERALKDGAPAGATGELAGEAYLAVGEAKELIDKLDKGTLKPTEPGASVLRGNALNALGQPNEALSHFEKALAADANLVSALVGRAESLAMLGRADDALAELARAQSVAKDGSGDARLLESRILMRRGQFAAAETALVKAQSLPPGSLSVPQRALLIATLSEAYLVQGKVPEAESARDQLAKIAPQAPFTRLLVARIALAKGDYVTAIAELQRLTSTVPNLLEARMLLGTAHISEGNLLQAENVLAALVQSAPDNIEARTLLARVRLQLDRPDAALRVLTPALEGEAADSQAYSVLADAYSRSGNEGLALDALERNVRAHPEDEQPKVDLARAYIGLGRPAAAIELLQSVDAGKRTSAMEALLVTAIAAERGPREARTQVEKLIAAKPRDPETLQLASAYFLSQREFERARSYLREILQQDPKSASALRSLARIDLAAGDPTGAEKNLREALALNDADTATRLAISGLVFRRGDADAALALAEEAAKKTPTALEPHFAMARMHLARKDAAKARTALDAAVAAGRGRADVVNAAGLLLLESQSFPEALERFRRAAEVEPTNASYWLNVGRSQLAMDQRDAARESLDRALKIRPDWIPAESMRVLLELRTNGAASAIERVKQLRSRQPKDVAAMALEGDVLMAANKPADAARAFAEVEKVQPDAAIAIKSYEAMRAANLSRPEQPLQRWLALKPEDYRVRTALSEFYISSNRINEAIGELEAIHKQVPNSAAILNNLAWMYLQRGDNRAEGVAKQAYELAPGDPSVTDTYGWILISGKQFDRALPLLEKAAKAAADDGDIQYHYAVALAGSNRKDEARTILQRIVSAGQPFGARRDAEKLLADLQG